MSSPDLHLEYLDGREIRATVTITNITDNKCTKVVVICPQCNDKKMEELCSELSKYVFTVSNGIA